MVASIKSPLFGPTNAPMAAYLGCAGAALMAAEAVANGKTKKDILTIATMIACLLNAEGSPSIFDVSPEAKRLYCELCDICKVQ